MEAGLYIATHSGSVELGEKMILTLRRVCEVLAFAPRIGRPHDDLRRRMRSHPVPPYVIFYRPARDGIYVMRVVHQRRDLATVFPRRNRNYTTSDD